MKTLLEKVVWWAILNAEFVLAFTLLGTKEFIIVQGIVGMAYLCISFLLSQEKERNTFRDRVQDTFNIVFKRKKILIYLLYILFMLLLISSLQQASEGKKEDLYECLNKVEINPIGKNFVNDLSSVSQQETLSVQTATSISMKVIMDIKDIGLQNIEVKEAPTRILYSGSYIEIGPERKEERKSSENREFLKIVFGERGGSGDGNSSRSSGTNKDTNGGGSWQNKQTTYLHPQTFNYIELDNGQITKERSIASKPQDFRNVNVHVQTSEQETSEKIVSIKRTYEKRTERQLRLFNKMGYDHQLTKQEREDASVLVSKFKDILGRMNHFVTLDPQTIIKDFECKDPYKVIYPNYKIENSTEIRMMIRVTSNNGLHYYFSNPECLPIFLENIPPVIERFIKSKNTYLITKRVQASNEYSQKYLLSDKQTVKSTKVLVLNKYGDQRIKDFPRTLSESGFKFENSLNQDYHVIWIISDQTSKLTTSQMNFIKQQYYKGTGLFLWADNAPFFADANRVLRELGFSFHLQGDYLGLQILQASDQLKQQTFDLNHPVSSGFKTLYEGNTICYPNQVTDGFQVFAYNSNPSALQPASIYKKATTKTGGIWIDTGFTKLFPHCHTTNRNEVIRYFTNVSLYIRRKQSHL